MKAKEMFEELGYQLIQDDMNWLIYSINNSDGWWNFNIEFEKKNKHIHITGKTPSHGKMIDMQELKAINKQIEELGWNGTSNE